MLKRVATVRTNFKVEDFIKSLIKAWYQIYKVPPVKAQIAVIYAQWGLETGLGTFCWNNNIGNVKAHDIPGVVVEYCALSGVWEIINGRRITLKPEDPGAWFRSFPTLDLGVASHLDLLRNKRYKIAWSAVEQGNPILFARLLKQQGYYTAPEADYSRAMQYYFMKFVKSNMFERVIDSFDGDFYRIEFPIDYTPLKFNVIEDVVEKPKTHERVSNKISSLINRIKNIFTRE
jgi:hypothetical protein